MPTFDDAIDHRLAGASSSPDSDGTDPDRDLEDLATRLAAVERALTDGDTPVADLDDAERLDQRLTALETAVGDLTDRVAELEAASSALRGYAAGVRAVNEDVERRADLALAKAETIERSLREDPGLRVERLDASITDEQAADGETRHEGRTRTRRDDRNGDRHDDESEKPHASDGEVSAAVESAPETDDATPSHESTRRSLSSRLRDVL